MEILPVRWSGTLGLTESLRFRAEMASALDRARAARALLALDLQQVGAIDSTGVTMLIAFGRTALALRVPVRIEHPPIQLRVDLHDAGAAGLFDWPTEEI